jgi:hypothetical protein
LYEKYLRPAIYTSQISMKCTTMIARFSKHPTEKKS